MLQGNMFKAHATICKEMCLKDMPHVARKCVQRTCHMLQGNVFKAHATCCKEKGKHAQR